MRAVAPHLPPQKIYIASGGLCPQEVPEYINLYSKYVPGYVGFLLFTHTVILSLFV